MPHKLDTKSGAETRILRTSTGYYTTSCERRRGKCRHTAQLCGRTTTRKGNTQGNTQLKYFLDETDELIKLRDYTEMDFANRRAEKIVGNLSDLC